MNIIKSAVLALLFLTVNMLAAQESISLNLKNGETYTLNQTTISNTDQVVDGMPIKTKTTVVAVTEFKVTGMNGKNYLMTITPTKMSTTQESDMGSMSMDSDGDTSDPMNMIMKNLVNKSLTMELTPYGDITNFSSDGYLDGIIDGIDMPAMAKIQLGAQMQEQYSDDALKDSYKFYFNFYPESKVVIGDTWKSELSVNVVVPMTAVTDNELKDITASDYMIYSTATLSTNGDQDSNMMGMQAKANLNGTLTTNYVIDKKTGWIASMEQTQNIEGDMTIAKSAQIPQEMKITMKVDAVNTVSSK